MRLRGSMENQGGDLEIGGLSVQELKEDYQTPLYIIDQEHLKETINLFLENFKSSEFNTEVIYASKAHIHLYMASLVTDLGLHLDVVSGGELYTALEAGVNPEVIHFHGNNKLPHELAMAVEHGVGNIIIDNAHEYHLLSEIAGEKNKEVVVTLRVNPSIEADTHKYIQTTTEDSKFGMNTKGQATLDLVKELEADANLNFQGFHCHIGSQITDDRYFFEEAEAMIAFVKEIEENLHISTSHLNLGGGFGVAHTEEAETLDLVSFLRKYIQEIEKLLKKYSLDLETVSIEPGRSLINPSGSTLYTVGGTKETEQGLPYVFVDGGMNDNPRVSLYEAEYEAILANKLDESPERDYRVAGKLCESGDVLVEKAALAEAEPGDLLLIPDTGAYTYSMASNYNRVERPAVVFVEDGESYLAVKRESYHDLLRNDIPYSNYKQ